MNINKDNLKKDIIQSYRTGSSVAYLVNQFGIAKSTINDWLRPVRLEIENDDLKQLSIKYSKLKKDFDKIKMELEIYKNLNCLPSSPRLDKLDAIKKFYNIYPVKTMCRILDVNVGTFYNHLNRKVPEKINITNDIILSPLVLKVFNKSKHRFGSTKIAQILRNDGYTISYKKAKQLMNELNITPVLGKKIKKEIINVENKNKFLKNKIGNNFNRNKPNEVWVTDVTEVSVLKNTFFICTILDLFSRKVIGHRVHCKNNTNLIINTLKDAYENRESPENVIIHSDRGSNYTSYKFRSLLKSLKLISSYSRTARPTENAVVESFFSHFKKEEIYRNQYNTLEELIKATDEYVEFFNDFRPHHHLNGQTPNSFEKNYLIKKD